MRTRSSASWRTARRTRCTISINEPDAGEMFEPGTQHYTVDIKSDDLIDLSTGWCAKDQATMEANEKHITGSITVDGYVIPDDQLVAFTSETAKGESSDYPDGLSCYSWDIVASNWPVGTHRVIESWTLDSALNDGYSDYAAGHVRHRVHRHGHGVAGPDRSAAPEED